MVVRPHRYAEGEPCEYPSETDEFEECIGLPISQARRDSNKGVFERDAYRLEEEKLKGFPLREILEEHVVSCGVDKPGDKKCCEKLEVGRKSSSWKVERIRKKICVAREEPAHYLVPDATVRFIEQGGKRKHCKNIHTPNIFAMCMRQVVIQICAENPLACRVL